MLQISSSLSLHCCEAKNIALLILGVEMPVQRGRSLSPRQEHPFGYKFTCHALGLHFLDSTDVFSSFLNSSNYITTLIDTLSTWLRSKKHSIDEPRGGNASAKRQEPGNASAKRQEPPSQQEHFSDVSTQTPQLLVITRIRKQKCPSLFPLFLDTTVSTTFFLSASLVFW